MQDSTHGSIYEEFNDSFENLERDILGDFEEMQDQTLISDFYFDKGLGKTSDEEEKRDNLFQRTNQNNDFMSQMQSSLLLPTNNLYDLQQHRLTSYSHDHTLMESSALRNRKENLGSNPKIEQATP
jgi:hypothetical protein